MSNCCEAKGKFDYLFWITFSISILGYFLYALQPAFLQTIPALEAFSLNVHEILGKMWWGIVIGVMLVGIIGLIPGEIVVNLMGRDKGIKSIGRAAIAGVVLDLCSHGILLVAMKLYERGVRLSQVVAFLIASPWNSLSLTVILISLIGLKWTLIYMLLSVLVAVISGLITEFLVFEGILKENPKHAEIPEGFSVKKSLQKEYEGKKFGEVINPLLFIKSFMESKMILRWVFLGVVAAGVIRTFVPTETFTGFFGPTITGLLLTLGAATVIEVCSEGSVPIAYDLFARAAAPGNAFLFLMAGASTDYTEIMALKETTGSWKTALFLPIVTVPQILVLGYALNHFTPN